MNPYWVADRWYLAILLSAVLIGAGALFVKRKNWRSVLSFSLSGAAFLVSYAYFALTSQTWEFWKAAFGSDPKRVIDSQKAIDLFSSSIFNNIFVSLSAIWLIGLFLWEYKLREISQDIIKRENDNSIKWLYFSCLGLFTAQIVIGYYWPNLKIFSFIITNAGWGMLKHVLRFIVAVAPVALSFYFCSRYWGYLEEELAQKKFNGSIYPTLMVAQGTFYTFVGVSAILLIYTGNKDVAQILQGLKLAFLTSVIGLLFSIAARFKTMAMAKEYYVGKAQRIPLDEYDFFVVLNGKMLPVFQKLSSQLDVMNKFVEQNNSILHAFGSEIVHTNRDMAKEQTDIFSRKLEEVFDSLKIDMEQISTISKDIRENFKIQKEETMGLVEKIRNLNDATPDLYGAAQGITKAVQETTKATAVLANNNTVQSLPNILANVKDLTIRSEKLNADIEKLYDNSDKYIEHIVANEATFSSIADNAQQLQKANNFLEAQIQDYIASLKQLNQLVGDAGLVKLPDLLKDTATVTENVGRLGSYTQTMYANIESNLENISKSAVAASSIAGSVEKISAANQTLAKNIAEYEDTIGKLNLPTVAMTLARLSDSYGNLEDIRTRDYEMLKNYDYMLKTQKETLTQQVQLLKETIDVIKRSEASYVGTAEAMANLGERIHVNADNIVSTLGEVDDKIRRHSLELEQKRYEEMLQQQKKYLKDLAKVRDETMRASLDVTNEVLNRVRKQYKGDE